MSSKDRASSVLWGIPTSVIEFRNWQVSAIVDALADAGLLMPGLPEPDDASIFVPDGAGWQTPQDSTVWTAIGGRVMIQRAEPGNFTPSEARSLAYALLAAAKLAEEQE